LLEAAMEGDIPNWWEKNRFLKTNLKTNNPFRWFLTPVSAGVFFYINVTNNNYWLNQQFELIRMKNLKNHWHLKSITTILSF
jgi:hypothetical protein